MKDYEFRAWDRKKKVMSYGNDFLVKMKKSHLFALNVLLRRLGHGIDGVEIMPFTGMMDKNKKKIFEKDIYLLYRKEHVLGSGSGENFKPGYHIVGWQKDGFYLKKDKEFEMEVVGNVHENKDLIPKGGFKSD